MANEINYSLTVNYSNSPNSAQFTKSGTVDQTTGQHESILVTADTTAAGVQVSFSTITAGYVMATCLNSTNSAYYGGSTGGGFV